MRVALLQLTGRGPDEEAALREGERWCRRAAARGADVAVLPELWQLGYTGWTDDPDGAAGWHARATTADGAFVRRFRALAAELGMAIVVTYLERRPGGRPRSVATLVDRHGDLRLTYAKVHTCAFGWEAVLEPGIRFDAVDLDLASGLVRVGLMVCFDREQPEAARVLMLAGAEVVLVPNACVLDDERLGQLRARAFEDMLGVAVVNYAAPGTASEPCNGRSAAFSGVCYRPDGRPAEQRLAGAGPDEQLVLADFDLAALRAYRAREPWGDAYRRPVAYGPLLAHGADPAMLRGAADGRRVPA